jgi:hypothetical protein
MVIQYSTISGVAELADVGAGSQNPALRSSTRDPERNQPDVFHPDQPSAGWVVGSCGSGYLCLRAIDEIEIILTSTASPRRRLLHNMCTIQSSGERRGGRPAGHGRRSGRCLPQVSVRLAE